VLAQDVLTYLNDAVLMAPSMLLVPAASWLPVDQRSFDVTLTAFTIGNSSRSCAARARPGKTPGWSCSACPPSHGVATHEPDCPLPPGRGRRIDTSRS
jgi:hypothetical protein